MAEKTVVVRLRAAGVGQFTQQFRQAAMTTQQTAASIASAAQVGGRAASAVARFAGIAGKALIVGVGAGLAISAKAAIEFQSSFAGIRKTVDTTEAGFTLLSHQMRQLALDIPIAVNELNRIGELGGQLDIKDTALAEFTKVIAELGVTTNLSTEEAAVGFARLANVLGVNQDQFDEMGSSIVALGNNFATTETEILNFATRISPVGSIVGLTVDQVLAIATAFTSVGIPAERGGTAVQKALSAMAEAIADGGDELETFAAAAGFTIDNFVELFERDAAQAFNAFIQGLGELQDAGENVFGVLDNVHLGNERTVQSLLAVAEAGDLLTRTLNESSTAFESNTALAAEAEKRFDTVASKIALAKNNIEDLRIEVGEQLLPVIGDGAETMGLLASAFKHADIQTKQTTAIIAGTVVVLARFARAALSAKTAVFSLSLGIKSLLGPAAIIGGIILLGKWATKQADAERATQDLTTAILEQNEAMNNAGVAAARTRILDSLDDREVEILSRALGAYNISLDDFAEAALTGGDALIDLERHLATGLEAYGAYRQEQEGVQEITGDNAIKTRQLGFAYEFLAGLLKDFNNEFSSARTRAAAEQLLIDNAKLAAQAEELTRMWGLWSGEVKASAAELARGSSAVVKMTQSVKGLLKAVDDLRDAELASRSAVFGTISAFQALIQAQQELRLSEKVTLEQQLAVQAAYVAFRENLLALGEEGIAPAIRNLQEMVDMGAITQEEFISLSLQMMKFADVVGLASGAAAGILRTNMGYMIGSINVGGEALNVMAGGWYGLGVQAANAAGAMVTAASIAQQALNAATSSSELPILLTSNPAQAASVLAVVQAITTAMGQFNNVFAGIGYDLGQDLAAGIGAGAGASDEPGKTIEEKISNAIRRTKDQLSTISGAVSASLSNIRSAQGLADAEKSIRDLRKEQRDLPRDLAKAEDELTEAKRRATEVTTDEQLAIDESREAYLRAQAAFSQGVISGTELKGFREDLTEKRQEAVSTDTPEVKAAQEELARLREREVDLPNEIADANFRVVEAQLALIDSQEQLVEAGRKLVAQGDKGVATFKRLGQAAGLSNKEIKNLIESYASLATNAAITAPTPLVNPSIGGETGTFPNTGFQAGTGAFASLFSGGQGGTGSGFAPKPNQLTKDRPRRPETREVRDSNAPVTVEAARPFPITFAQQQPITVTQSGPIAIEQARNLRVRVTSINALKRSIPVEITNLDSLPHSGNRRVTNIKFDDIVIRGIWDMTNARQTERIVNRIAREIERRGRAAS